MTLLATKTQTSSTVSTAVTVAVAVVLATTIGTGIAVSQWQQSNKAAITVEDLDDTSTETEVDYVKLTSTPEEDEAFGGALANVGDLNGDGHDDLVIADVDYWVTDAGEYQQGKIYGYYGNDTALSTTADWTITASSGYDYADFGQSVSGAGDVNGDGYDDFVVGAPADGEYQGGMVYGYYGSATGPDVTTASWEVTATEYDDGTIGQFGYVVAGLGDINGDSYDDVGVYDGEVSDTSDSDTSRLLVYLGSSTGLATTASWQFDAPGDLANLETQPVWLAGADVNGDGYADMIVGNPDYGNGSLLAFYGSASGFRRLRPDFRLVSRIDNYFGNAVSSAGDVNADGYDDVVVGAPSHTNSEDGEGMVAVYYGSSTGLSASNKWQVESNVESAWLGGAVSSALDANADGYVDILVTAPNYDQSDSGDTTGRAWLYAGSAAGMVRQPPLGMAGTFPEGDVNDFGIAVTSSETLIGSSGVDLVVAVGSWQDDETYGPAVLVYPDINL